MPDARYFRSQAELCLEVAQQLSDRQAADHLRAQAAQYIQQAVALEVGPAPDPTRYLRDPEN